MLRKPRALAILSLLILSAVAYADLIPDEVAAEAAKLRDAALQDSMAYEVVESLTMEVGPRSAGSAGDKAAVAWGVKKLQELGFKNVHTEEVLVPHWDRGLLTTNITAPYPQRLTSTSLGGSPGTDGVSLESKVLRVTNLDELRALSSDELNGNIIYIDHIMERTIDGAGYSAASRIRSCAHYIAAERGALATLIRSAGTSVHRVPHTGSMIRNDIPPTIPAIALANADADLLSYQLDAGKPVSIQLNSTAQNYPKEKSANVIGEVPGKGELADEIVILGAHLDSWDLGTGAIDDGSGVAIVTAAAKMILDSGEAPRRTIRVVLFANEEQGGWGSKQYARAHASELQNHVAAVEPDLGAGRIWQFETQVPASWKSLPQELAEQLTFLGIEQGGNVTRGGPDLQPLKKWGVPIIGLNQDGTYYFDYHHTEDDTLDKIDPADLRQSVAAHIIVSYLLANMK